MVTLTCDKVNGELINAVRYADDTVIISDSLEDLESSLSRVSLVSEETGLNLNIYDTKCIILNDIIPKIPYY